MTNRDQDQKMELAMGNLLRTGVIVCCVVMVFGAVLYLAQQGARPAVYTRFHGEPADLESVSGVLRGVRSGSAQAIIQLGALLMIATPVLRVIFALVGFAAMKDWRFTAISATVLALLLFGLFVSH
jgi:uncharacterized membrane protein